MKIMIEGKDFTQQELEEWKKKRVRKVLRNLKKSLSAPDDDLCKRLTDIKMDMSYEEITSSIHGKLAIGRIGMKIAVVLSGGKRKTARTTLYADGITVEKLGVIIDALMMEGTEEFRRVNLGACPDHYVLRTEGATLEVIETTGNTPVPTQFFITFNDETGLKEPRDGDYPYQSVGIAKLKDGTVIGGVRHQFRNYGNGIEAKAVVEFPAMCPASIVKEHQKHLGAEWSSWIQWAIDHQERWT